ncbi:MAG: acetate/propionate family kinase [Gammaproteobacteria bacterium]|nr:acetate/propionate family kinase [Gammaproteobacteria bacterium]MDH3369756.1 acetate/propionate family kinase [Gammaproteobacteria bacterium]MDH3405609.1 acetate/propionate family kinase [Gammaproteobacteria bacterium]MDH5486618.1 acetate/propionate family kinase [Gammaproteobacteria bacterium]
MKILTVNAGSSSIRLVAFETAAENRMEQIAYARHESSSDKATEATEVLRQFIQTHALSGFALVAHRVVHGGDNLQFPTLINPEVEAEIDRLAPLAPLHNPAALQWMRACRETLGSAVKQVAVFDTAYYARLPEVARIYALPAEMTERHHLRRYGFHGLAHEAMWRRWRERRSGAAHEQRIISLQLGAGCSITATDKDGVKDTSMGFSPLEGLVMATRSGDIDAGLITHLQQRENLSPQDTERLLNDASGLLGVSGLSGDMRELLESGDPRAQRAVDLYCYRIRKYIGAYIAVLGGVDAVLIGGGVGENAPEIRARIFENMKWAGIRLDPGKNAFIAGNEQLISRADSRAEIWVIPVNEARILAQAALAATAES